MGSYSYKETRGVLYLLLLPLDTVVEGHGAAATASWGKPRANVRMGDLRGKGKAWVVITG